MPMFRVKEPIKNVIDNIGLQLIVLRSAKDDQLWTRLTSLLRTSRTALRPMRKLALCC